MILPEKIYFKIGEVARLTGLKAYVLRYWETEFKAIQPVKSRSGQRLYRKRDVELIVAIRELLYERRYTIEGARKKIREISGDGELALIEGTTPAPVALQRIRDIAHDILSLASRPVA